MYCILTTHRITWYMSSSNISRNFLCCTILYPTAFQSTLELNTFFASQKSKLLRKIWRKLLNIYTCVCVRVDVLSSLYRILLCQSMFSNDFQFAFDIINIFDVNGMEFHFTAQWESWQKVNWETFTVDDTLWWKDSSS